MLTHDMPCVTHMACHVTHACLCHVSLTWLAMCHSHGLPCVTHMACHGSLTWLAMCHSHGLPCVTTWFAMCHPHGSPCVIHMVRHVSSTWLAMCRPVRVSSKYVKFRLSRNSTKFDWVANFHETIPMVQSVLSSGSRKIPIFLQTISINFCFPPFLSENFKFKISTGFTIMTLHIQNAKF